MLKMSLYADDTDQYIPNTKFCSTREKSLQPPQKYLTIYHQTKENRPIPSKSLLYKINASELIPIG